VGPLLLAGFFAGLATWSWDKWADVHVDFGNELYAAWRVSEGDTLYLDLAYRHGPLPHTLNALWFTLFGVSIRTLVLCNLALLVVMAALTWSIFRRACGSWVATAVTAVLLGVFSFSQYVGIGNFNFVTPYHHHQSHGLLLTLLMIAAFGRAFDQRGPSSHGLAGLCLGGVFLTKAELFVPAAGAAAVGFLLQPPSRRASLAFVGGAAALPVGFWLWLLASAPAALAVEGVLGNWAWLGGGVIEDPYYVAGMGLDDPAGNLRGAAVAFTCLAGFAAAALLLDRWLAPRARGAAAGVGAALVAAAALQLWPGEVAWFPLARGLPLAASLVAAGLLVHAWRVRSEAGVLAQWGPLCLFAVAAVGLLGKMLLLARFEHYGFALAMPATHLAVAALLDLLPRWLAPGTGGIARGLAAGAVLVFVVSSLERSNEIYRRKDFALGTGADRILGASPYASRRPELMGQALERLEALVPERGTLLVLPEGSIFNYLLRKKNPTRHQLYLPVEMDAFGEDEMLRDLAAHPPDVVALVHRRWQSFGVGPFGEDDRNGRALVAWLDENYRRVARLGAEPFTGDRFGVVILRRAEGAGKGAS